MATSRSFPSPPLHTSNSEVDRQETADTADTTGQTGTTDAPAAPKDWDEDTTAQNTKVQKTEQSEAPDTPENLNEGRAAQGHEDPQEDPQPEGTEVKDDPTQDDPNDKSVGVQTDEKQEPNQDDVSADKMSQGTSEQTSAATENPPQENDTSRSEEKGTSEAADDQVRVTKLTIYPIKACAGVEISEARVTATGFENDRLFMVVDFTGRDLTQKKYPALALAQPTILDNGNIRLEAQGVRSVEFTPKARGVKKTVTAHSVKCEAVDQGDQPADFFSSLLEISGVRLVRMRDGFVRSSKDGSFQTSFADVFPFLLISDASHQQVQQWADRSVDIRRFRANIVVNGETMGPFEEDAWNTVRISDCKFNVARGCTRCTVVNVDPETAEPDDDGAILETLKSHRSFGNAVMFGQNMVPLIEKGVNAVVRVGDIVSVVDRQNDIPKPDATD